MNDAGSEILDERLQWARKQYLLYEAFSMGAYMAVVIAANDAHAFPDFLIRLALNLVLFIAIFYWFAISHWHVLGRKSYEAWVTGRPQEQGKTPLTKILARMDWVMLALGLGGVGMIAADVRHGTQLADYAVPAAAVLALMLIQVLLIGRRVTKTKDKLDPFGVFADGWVAAWGRQIRLIWPVMLQWLLMRPFGITKVLGPALCMLFLAYLGWRIYRKARGEAEASAS